MRPAALVLATAFLLAAAVSNAAELPGVYGDRIVTPDGTMLERSTTGTEIPHDAQNTAVPVKRNDRLHATQMWVDRNHLNAVAEDVAISGTGQSIVAGWWLNNERLSLYNPIASSTPLWTLPLTMYDPSWQIPPAAAFTNVVCAGGSNAPFWVWMDYSPSPIIVFDAPSGFRTSGPDLNDAGTLMAGAVSDGAQGIAYLIRVPSGDTIWSRQFTPTQGLQGARISADGNVIVVTSYGVINVWDSTGTSRGTVSNYGQIVAAVSGDGTYIATADYNTYIRLYTWNGSTYQQTDSDYFSGYTWCTAVDLSDDGLVCAGGATDIYDPQDGSVRFYDIVNDTFALVTEHTNYGGYVSDVSLSADGQHAIASNWGRYQGTVGEVATVFSRSGGVYNVVLSLLDDIDEPGSLFSCAISSDGAYATTGGKAVHAYQSGNGGEVYAFIVADPLTHDVGVAAILEPTEFITPGVPFTPRAAVRNVGSSVETFDVSCTITPLGGPAEYGDTVSITSLVSMGLDTAAFAQHTLSGSGRYLVEFATMLPGDEYPDNDTLAILVRDVHDAAARSIAQPFPEITYGLSVTPQGEVANFGSYTESFDVELIIRDSVGSDVYADTATSPVLPPYSSNTVSFVSWSPPYLGSFSAVMTTLLAADDDTTNDSIEKTFDAVEELIYDDGSPDAWYVVSFSYDSNRFAVRFTPVSYPAQVVRVRMHTRDAANMQLTINDPSGGLPGGVRLDLGTFSFGTAPDWYVYDIPWNLQPVYNSDDFWFVMHFDPPTPGDPAFGTDYDDPTDGRTWWFTQSNGWNQLSAGDLLVRALCTDVNAAPPEDPALPGELALYPARPNPFNPTTSFSFDLPATSDVRLEVFDVLGRRTATVLEGSLPAGRHTAGWDASDLPSGVYFARLSTPTSTRTTKLVLLK
jgi:hypothetical protein